MTNLASSIVQQYEQEGYVIVPNVLDAPLTEKAKTHIESLQAKYPHLRAEQLGTGHVEMDSFWLELVSDERLLDIAEQFIGPNIALFASHYIAKPPYNGQAVMWHQDGSFWPLEPMQVVTFWLAIDDSDTENGCLRVFPQTQHSRLLSKDEMEATPGDENALSAAMDISDLDENEAVDLIMKSGDIEIHHPNIIHGSNPNKSPRWRRGLTIRYIPTSTQVTDPHHARPYLLRGTAVPSINDYALHPDIR